MASWSDLVDGLEKIGSAGANVYKAFSAEDGAEETAYLKGQLAGIQATQQAQEEANTIRIGDTSISTSSLLWIVGGSLGLLLIGIAAKKLI